MDFKNKNQEKFKIFLEVTRNLNEIGIIPILVGSLGLSKIIGDFKECEDIDLLVPNNFLEEDFEKIANLMEILGFKLKDEKKFIFDKGKEEVSFQKEDDPDGVIKIKNLVTSEIDGIKFKELSVKDHLNFYEEMLKDENRKKIKGKDDEKKIELIHEFLKRKEKNKEAEYLEGWKRCQADFENYKKRQSENLAEMIKYSNQGMILEILPVLDNFHASTDHIPEDQKGNAWVVGIMHIQKQLEKVLADNGVEEIPVKVGDTFNPEIHEAVHVSSQSTVPSSQSSDLSSREKEDREPLTNNHELITKVILKGYKLGDKIIRAARVIVE